MRLNRRNSQNALTLIEVLVVIAVIVLVIWMLLPKMDGNKASATRTQCINNLKQLGLGFHQWSLDYSNQLPMEIPVREGGTKELIKRGGVSSHFLSLAAEINTPKILFCPTDKGRKAALSFTNGFSDANISYFVGVDVVLTNFGAFLAGDRNITNGTMRPNGMLELKSNDVVQWTMQMHKRQGDILLGDASVQALSDNKLREALNETGLATNRLAMPLE